MRIAFYSPADYKNNLQKRYSGPTIGLAYIASNIREKLGIKDISVEVDIDYMLAKKPDLIGISSYTEEFDRAIEAAKAIKARTNIPVLIGGAHITALPDTLPEHVDIGVTGDGEETIIELLRLYQSDKLFDTSSLEEIQGLVFRKNGEMIKTSKRDIPMNLDDLPAPDRSIFRAFHPELNQTLRWNHRLYTSRGCPFSCIFCMYSKMTKRNMRYHSLERVISDIYDIRRDAPEQEHIFIADDLFVIDKKRLYEISKAIRQEKLHKQVSFMCLVRANVFDDEIAAILKSMNTNMVSFGFESGSDKILRYLKGGISVKHNQRAADSCEKYGIKTGAYFVTGSPVETYDDLAKTYWFIRKNQNHLKQVETFCLIPLPETVVWDYAVKEGFIDMDNINWKNISYLSLQNDNYLFMNKEYSYEEFKYAHSNFFSRYNKWSVVVYQREQLTKTFQDCKLKVINDILDIPIEHNLLEISTSAETLNLDHENITFVSSAETEKIEENVKYDTVFINNVFMVHVNPEEVFRKASEHVKDDGEVKVFVYNIANLDNVNKLFTGTFDSDFLSYCNINLKNTAKLDDAKAMIEKTEFEITDIKTYKVMDTEYQELKSFIDSLNSYIKIKSFDELNIFGYLITCSLK